MEWEIKFGARDRERDNVDGSRFEKTGLLSLGVSVEKSASAYRSRAVIALRQGIGILGATSASGRDTRSSSISGSYRRWQAITQPWWLGIDVTGQFSCDDLLGSERFYPTSHRLGSALEPGQLSGDSGVGTRSELRRVDPFHLFAVPVTFYGFYDDIVGVSSNRSDERASAAAAGSGVIVTSGRVSAHAELAQPLTTPSLDRGNDARVSIGITTSF
jgi:hemolysin activation/secretion protein